MFVEWNNKMILLLEVKEMSITGDLFDTSSKMDFTGKCDREVKLCVEKWYDSGDMKSLIIKQSKNNKTTFYYFENATINMLKINNQGNLSSFKLNIKGFKDITRKYKIKKMMNSLEPA